MRKYAQIDAQGICVAETQSDVEMAGQQLLEVTGQPSRLGMLWDGVDWHPVPEPAPSLVPQKVTRRQARQALLLSGLLDQVEPAIQAITDPMQRQLALIEWQDSLEFERHRPLLITLGAALGLDEAALDQLFMTAATL